MTSDPPPQTEYRDPNILNQNDIRQSPTLGNMEGPERAILQF
jgi:hypothetical protein